MDDLSASRLSSLLSALGVSSSTERDSVEADLLALFTARGITLSLASLRHGKAVLLGSPQAVFLARLALPDLDTSSLGLSSIVIRTPSPRERESMSRPTPLV